MEQYRNDALDKLFSKTSDMPREKESSAPTSVKCNQQAPVTETTEHRGELQELPIALLQDFATGMEKQPFRPYCPKDLEALAQDISVHGMIQPLVVRPLDAHRYEIIAGHNRRSAARAVGYETVPCLVRNLSDEEAIVQMCSTNLQQRKDLLPSEKAFAYKAQLEAMKRKAGRPTRENPSRVGTDLRSDAELASQVGESRNQIQRYIRLTELIPALLTAVDEKKLGLNIGVTLSFLSPNNQEAVEAFCLQEHSLHINQTLADQLREADANDTQFTADVLKELTHPSAKNLKNVTLPYNAVKRYFPTETSSKEIETTIQKALKLYFAKENKSL